MKSTHQRNVRNIKSHNLNARNFNFTKVGKGGINNFFETNSKFMQDFMRFPTDFNL